MSIRRLLNILQNNSLLNFCMYVIMILSIIFALLNTSGQEISFVYANF